MSEFNSLQVASYEVSINNMVLDLERRQCITSIDITEQVEGSDSCSIIISDPDMVFIEDSWFVEDYPFSIKISWFGIPEAITFNGYVSAIDIEFPESGAPILNIFCLDKTHLMNKEKKTRSWDNVTRAQVAQRIAQEYGLGFHLEAGYNSIVEETISQSKSEDIAFVESLAGQETQLYICKVVGNTMYYIKKGTLGVAVAAVGYKTGNRNVISFNPQLTTESRQVLTKDSSMDSATKSVSTGSSPSSSGGSGKNTNTGSGTSSGSTGAATSSAGSTNTSYTYNPATGNWAVSNTKSTSISQSASSTKK